METWEKGSKVNSSLVVTALVVNLAMYVGLNLGFGGMALNGKVVSGHYFVGEHRHYHEVSAATYACCKALESAALVFLLGAIAYAVLHFWGCACYGCGRALDNRRMQ